MAKIVMYLTRWYIVAIVEDITTRAPDMFVFAMPPRIHVSVHRPMLGSTLESHDCTCFFLRERQKIIKISLDIENYLCIMCSTARRGGLSLSDLPKSSPGIVFFRKRYPKGRELFLSPIEAKKADPLISGSFSVMGCRTRSACPAQPSPESYR